MAALLPDFRTILRDVRGDDDLELDASTRFDGIPGWDSIDLVSAVAEVECRLGLRFDAAEIERLGSLGDLANVVMTKLALAAA